ncbi:MAG: sigma 54-interacting transcriptional regulator [Desulfobacteraceae bacterium]|nr:sigma 54-interacting transcriptional regulator [Desulfobacteraceae bacterium]
MDINPTPPNEIPQSAEKAVLALSRSFNLMSLNMSAKQLLGCNPAPGEIFPLQRLFANGDAVAAHQAFETVVAQAKEVDVSLATVIGADGLKVPCEYAAQPILRGPRQVIGVIFTLRRLSSVDRPVLASPIETIEPMPLFSAQGLFDDLPKGSFTIDTHWRITTFNRAAENLTGFRREEAISRHCWEIFRSDLCGKQCPMRLALDRKQTEMDRQVFAVSRHGLRQALTVNVSLLKDEAGHIVGAVETFHPAGGDRPTAFAEPGRLKGIIGNSTAMRELFAKLPDLAASRANVLICGESGTGKELIARTLHQLSGSHDAPFVAVNCAALAESLIEAELFGHEKGAFTGAEQSRPGRFELAGKGTLLLDEIGELKPDLQVKLLRVIEQRSFERVGGIRSMAFEARLISATHQDLSRAIQEKRFREDLYYRLRTVTIMVPPLRERTEDIPLLVDHFIRHFNAKTGKQVRSLDPKVMQRLMAYHWPGNVRELQRCIEHAFVFVKGPVIFQHYLPELETTPAELLASSALPVTVEVHDRDSLLWALKQAGGRRAAAAKLLGISRTSMWRRMKAMGL